MTWEISVVLATFFVPATITFMANKTLDEQKGEVFYWLKLLIFIINLYIIGAGLWIGREIANANNSTIADLIQAVWQGYMWASIIIVVVVVLITIFDLGLRMYKKFPSLSERR